MSSLALKGDALFILGTQKRHRYPLGPHAASRLKTLLLNRVMPQVSRRPELNTDARHRIKARQIAKAPNQER